MTVVVDVTDAGQPPEIGRRLRRFAVRVLFAVGLAAVAWLCGAVLSAGTAAADESPSTLTVGSTGGTDADGLIDTIVAPVLGSADNALGGTVSGLTDAVTGTVTDAIGDPVPATPARTTHPVTDPVPASAGSTSDTVTTTTQHRRAAVSVSRAEPAARHRSARRHRAHVVAERVSTGTVIRLVITTAPRRSPPSAPAPVPQAPSPDVPTSSINVSHETGSVARDVTAAHVTVSAPSTPFGFAGWRADSAAPTARSQGLPATSPD